MDDQRKQALPVLINELAKQVSASSVLAERHEAAAQLASESAKDERANAKAYATLKEKLEKELGVSNVLPVENVHPHSSLNGFRQEIKPKTVKVVRSYNRKQPAGPGLADMITAILQQHPDGITKAEIKKKLAEQGREIQSGRLASVLTANPKFQMDKLSSTLFHWRYSEPRENPGSWEEIADSQTREAAEAPVVPNSLPTQTTLLG